MSETNFENQSTIAAGEAKQWNWNPDLPIPVSPLFAWPPRPLEFLKWISAYWLVLSSVIIELILAFVIFWFTQPEAEIMKTLSFGWIATIWLRNLFLLCLVAGSLHLWLYGIKGQGVELKFDARQMVEGSGIFTFRNQVHDNMFWSLVSGVTLWTIFEVLYFWSAANGWAPVTSLTQMPIWSVIWFILIPLWASFHFYWIHRALHWPALYKIAHHLHHRNISTGPWSGLSMHPIEHLLYFSSLLIHFIIPSDPIHILFHLYNLTLNPAFSHSGFESLLLKGRKQLDLGDFFHQLHHRYFECNYGTAEVPWDAVFGSFHDGTPQANQRIRDRKKQSLSRDS